MSNQDRKHWPTVIEAVSLIPNAVLWAHTDRVIHGWNLQALAFEYGVADRVVADIGERSDKEMAALYSACDATLVISGGEGFCYPVVESMSCGVPVVTGAYGAQADFWHWKVAAKAFRIETPHNVRRAVYEAADVAQALRAAIDRGGGTDEERQVEHLDWPKLGKVWKKWARKGIACDSGYC
jgi:glycosyltransferase involved in cell wall biosynthesis